MPGRAHLLDEMELSCRGGGLSGEFPEARRMRIKHLSATMVCVYLLSAAAHGAPASADNPDPESRAMPDASADATR